MNEEEDCNEGFQMTLKNILAICEKSGLYLSPECNDVLYLNNKGFEKIGALELFVNAKAIWLNNNAITLIEGLDTLTNLTLLYLQDNMLSEMVGLETLVSLETLVLSHNYITHVAGLAKCRKLATIELDHNRITDISGLLECPTLESINLSHNMLTGESVLDILNKFGNLRVLRLEGNPIVREMSNYRRRLINMFPNLTFLDENPVTNADRRLAYAWSVGGRDAEMDERHKMNDEREVERHDNMLHLRRLQRDAMLERGESIENYPELLSSDDEDAADLMKAKFKREAADGNEVD